VAKEAAKEAARPEAGQPRKRPRKQPATKEAARLAKKAVKASMSIATGDVIRCDRAICQGTQKYTGASWTHQFGKRKQIWRTSCGKKLEVSKWVVVAA
jgi:hypothetical protein